VDCWIKLSGVHRTRLAYITRPETSSDLSAESEAFLDPPTGDAAIELSHLNGTTPHAPFSRLTPTRPYASLPVRGHDRSIRVIDLDPLPAEHYKTGHGQGSKEKSVEPPLTCRLRVISLASSAHFTALSYVWGQVPKIPNPDDVITCNDSFQIQLTPNCHDALLALRRNNSSLTIHMH